MKRFGMWLMVAALWVLTNLPALAEGVDIVKKGASGAAGGG
jgi:hypothetical protein